MTAARISASPSRRCRTTGAARAEMDYGTVAAGRAAAPATTMAAPVAASTTSFSFSCVISP